ncbi:VIT1/CCC1 transporter family protein [Methylocapsa palsarum]|uniref:Predicted Fe2+/Mn2+ transporter, VIT1/CCC1 family n=1 Tax=Methylocapsa palsarum TaxID=1612308 RepID=A0A1I3YDN8_9HYPH|nr:VIT1/CCC1 transporter family protein [Methylocapsa palsarum]SFK29984.1 Predicted Fe2+/Mn2+ transporter, VIT1/CCC1 family [Methylocapsa palsarum]
MAELSRFDKLKKSLAASAGDVVFGMEDGTVSIFGLVLGVAATTNDSKTVLIAGASGACAAAVSMMAGTYLDVETSLDEARTFNALLAAEIKQDPHAVVGRIADRMHSVGMNDVETADIVAFVRSEPALLRGVAAAMTSPAATAVQSPLAHALWMLVADFLSAAIPIVPFALTPVHNARWISSGITLALLISLGVGRARIGRKPVGRTVIETVLIGVSAALAGVAIGLIITHSL